MTTITPNVATAMEHIVDKLTPANKAVLIDCRPQYRALTRIATSAGTDEWII